MGYYAMGGRARGLSYTPVILGTQLCLLFATLFGFLLHKHGASIFTRLNSRVLLIAAVVSLVSVASGNRSPLLGFIIFFAVYAWLIKPKLPALLLTLFALIVVPFADQIFLMLEQFGLRVGSTQDSSAVSRNVLQVYGILLFLGQPFGYGLDFNSVDHADQYRSILSGFEYADRIAKVALHNYFLMILNKYGALILIDCVPCCKEGDENRLVRYSVSFRIWFTFSITMTVPTKATI